ncbi:hypothetical protein BAL199_12831 [alpha proteobacterium BAL199]|jgi:hypothetical protein|nr:hypothetical protein BAL199_12831 [alpha proteobacterium BAL199]
MRQGPHQKRGRGRGNHRRSNTPNRNQTFDSNGPDVRIRGNATQVHEKYLNLARDAAASGDRVLAESYFQHAEHYYRILSVFQDAQGGENRGQQPNQNGGSRDWDQDDDDRDSGGDDRNDRNGDDSSDRDRGDRQRAETDRGSDGNNRGGDGNNRDRGDRFNRERGDRGDRDRNAGDRNGGDRNGGERNGGDRDRNDRNAGDRDRGDRRPPRAESDVTPRGDRPEATPVPQPQPAEAASPSQAELPVIPAPQPTAVQPKLVPVEPVAAVSPAAEPQRAEPEEDGIRRTLRLTPSRAPRATAAPASSKDLAAAPIATAVEEAVEPAPSADVEPIRKPRRRKATPKAEAADKSEDSLAPSAVNDDEGSVAAS